jgi:hypothetical protein
MLRRSPRKGGIVASQARKWDGVTGGPTGAIIGTGEGRSVSGINVPDYGQPHNSPQLWKLDNVAGEELGAVNIARERGPLGGIMATPSPIWAAAGGKLVLGKHQMRLAASDATEQWEDPADVSHLFNILISSPIRPVVDYDYPQDSKIWTAPTNDANSGGETAIVGQPADPADASYRPDNVLVSLF